MTLRATRDVGAADWITSADARWYDLVAYGPPGFEAYVQLVLRGDAEPDHDGSDLDDPALRRALAEVLPRHTTTTEQAYHALWDGGGLEGRSAQDFPDAFPPAVMKGPRVRLGEHREREYLLFVGPLDQIGDWGDDPDHGGVAGPHLLWPADHAWCVASDVDGTEDHDVRWVGVGGSRALIDDLHADDRFDVVAAHPYR
ncbi:hypothetical protein [Mumia zhuanghuii]|uniref:Uncharacterized protein n=1 Tax=Mumia zhuanghuii TaxID=2585211 RepID=A0A5C4MIV0_9ACTN|nr:hypothetical protein [Mumia zhuanghuii]TNC31211.1 hypothetical protein FHE65_31500 [Mumia zhuanghuii]TNC44928.1 hypothetical protein FHE65_16000 [Mumia zhuanghuii]